MSKLSTSTANDLQNRFEMKTVLETSRMLIESKSSDFVLSNLLLIVMGKLLTSKAAILLYEQSKNKYRIEKSKGIQPQEQVEIGLKPGEKKQSLFLYKEYPNEFPSLAENMENSVFFPLRTSSHHIGFLFLGGKASNEAYTSRELEFVESLCIISSVAIANTQLFEELRSTNRKLDQRIHELNTLFDLSKEFNLLTDRNKITNIFKFALLGQLFVRTFFLIYKTPDKIAVLGLSGLKKTPEREEFESIFEECPADIFVPDASFSENHPMIRDNQIANLIGVSIQGEKVAVIGIGKRVNGEPFAETDFNFLKSLANLAIVSIQKTFLLEERIDKERMEEELSIAKSIQRGLLPDPIPEIDGIDLAARNTSSREVGGDYYDVATTPDGNTILAIADVTGKGVPAALLMANLQSMLHVLLPVDISLADATERINNLIHKNTPSDKFITFFWAKYYSSKRVFSYVNAGHNPPVLLRHDSDEFEELSDGGLLLGAMETMMPYEQTDITLQKGDLIVCYTDGVNEAMNEAGDEEYGEERLMECIKKNRDLPSKEILDKIEKDVKDYSKGILIDDLTLLVIKLR
ncbi:MAG: SpoIIE family protein phosphatase [Balneolaceae bacterium]|nr:SpoIIE family protein phosphatase [Balneolaceae bacterium]